MDRRGKQGFTLLELVVALTIVGITGLFTAKYLWPQLDIYERFSERTDGKYICETLFELIEPEMRFGRNFAVADDGTLYYQVVGEGGEELAYRSLCRFDSNTNSFIPKDCYITVSYKVDKATDMVTISMRVWSTDPEVNSGKPLFMQDAVIRSLYSLDGS